MNFFPEDTHEGPDHIVTLSFSLSPDPLEATSNCKKT